MLQSTYHGIYWSQQPPQILIHAWFGWGRTRSRHRKEQKCDWKGKQRKDGLNAEGRTDLSLEALEGVSAMTGPGPLQAPMDCKAKATSQKG